MEKCPRLKKMITDFEIAYWSALQIVAQRNERIVKHQGCAFHWSQAVYRYFGKIGLISEYNNNRTFKAFARKIFALPFLPSSHIQPAFDQLFSGIGNNRRLKKLKKYFYNVFSSLTIPRGVLRFYSKLLHTNKQTLKKTPITAVIQQT